MNYWKKLNLVLLLVIIDCLLPTYEVFAQFVPPAFSSCPNVSGSVQSNFSSGEHAIVGVEGLEQGSDEVFSVGQDNFIQCFCPPNGSGTQTNWLAAGSLTQEDQNNLRTQGWVLIPNGADWGLTAQPYLAQNISFSCSESNIPTPTPGSSGASSGVGGAGAGSGAGQGGSAGSSSETQAEAVTPIPSGEVLGISTLAATGSRISIYLEIVMLVFGVFLIYHGLSLRRPQARRLKTRK